MYSSNVAFNIEINDHWSIEEDYTKYGNYHYKQHEADISHFCCRLFTP